MKKQDMVELFKEVFEFETKREAEEKLDLLNETIINEVSNGEEVPIGGVTILTKDKDASSGIMTNAKGEKKEWTKPAYTSVKVKIGKKLKDAVL